MRISMAPSLVIAAIVAILSLTALPTTAAAQPCTSFTITNNTGVNVDLTFYTAVGTFTYSPIVPGTNPWPIPFGGLGYVSALGNRVSAAGMNPCTGCITLWLTGGSGTICAILCSGPTAPPACSMTINPVVPCPTNCQ